MNLKIFNILIIFAAFTFNSCPMFSEYNVDGEINVKSYWIDSLNKIPDYELINNDAGNNYYVIEIEYLITNYEVEFGRKLEDYLCEISLEFPPYIFKKKVGFKKNNKGEYVLKLNMVTSIADENMYTTFFHNYYSVEIYDITTFNFGNKKYIFPVDEYSDENKFRFTYPDGTTPDDWIVFDSEL